MRLHVARGSPKPALFYVDQTIELAESTASAALVASARGLRAEIYLLRGSNELVTAELDAASDMSFAVRVFECVA